MSQGRYSSFEIRVRAVAALRRGMPVGEVAEAYAIDRTTAFRWNRRFQAGGIEGLRRQPGSGRPRLLEDLDEAELRRIILEPASAFGFETDLWTVGRLRRVIQESYRVVVSPDTVWRRLRDAGLTYQKPERHYFEADDQTRQHWLQWQVPEIRAAVRDFRAILYFQDEANVSLCAFLGKTWAPRGQTPRLSVTGKRGSVSAMSALSARGRLVFTLHEERIVSAHVIHFLEQMLAFHPKRHLVVVMDQAPPHVSKITTAFIASQSRLHVFYLPKYSPDWNPDEKVWNHLKHHELKGHQAKTKTELKKLTRAKLNKMANDPDLLRGLFFRCYVADLFG